MPANAVDQPVIEVSVEIAAAPATVWRFFTDPIRFAQWMGDSATLLPEVGGALRVGYPGGDIAEGTITAMEPERRVEWTWGYAGEGNPVPVGSTVVTITLEKIDTGTRVTLTHAALATAPVRLGHTQGWNAYLSALANAAALEEQTGRVAETIATWCAAWGITDATARGAALERCATENVTFDDRYARIAGRTALDAHMAAAQQMVPGAQVVPDGPPRLCHNHVLYGWRVPGPGDITFMQGTNYAELAPDGRFVRVVGFWA
ncbi:MAG: SRPBCC domain-containing protein [bacterium]